jgi:N-acetylneuraminic acid mutarotase
MRVIALTNRDAYLRRTFLTRRVAVSSFLIAAGLLLAHPSLGQNWTATGSLGAARDSHTATLLPNGKVLIAGGATGGGAVTALATAELYDPASGTWTATGSLATARIAHTATLLPNGKVLVAGGNNQNNFYFTSAELYDPASGTWSAAGSLNAGRGSHTATLLSNGKVLVAAGYNNTGPIAGAELFDPASGPNGTWTATGSLNTARYIHTATLLTNGKVLVVGGIDSTVNPTASAELFDPASGANGTWTATPDFPTTVDGHTATLLPNGKVLVAFGSDKNGFALNSSQLFDPAGGTNGSWAATGSLSPARFAARATLLTNGRVLVEGGSSDSGADAALYDPTQGTWVVTGSLKTGRFQHTATVLSDGRVLVAGGYNGGELNSAEIYDGGLPPPVLLNISTRMRVLTSDQVLIGGFIITGSDPKKVIIRGMGPSLNGVGVTLSDPTLELHRGNTTLATNDNWKIDDQTGQSQETTIRATTIQPGNDLESAIVATLVPGAYTAVLAGKNGGTGVGLVEVYDLAQAADSKLANIATRGFVDTDNNVMIGGLIVGGGGGGPSAKVIVRAIGPSLPVPGALADPTLELHDVNGATVATNDNWKTDDQTGQSQEDTIRATTIPPSNDLESALVATLAPGNYTAIVRGKNNTTGVGLVEVYNLQ